MRPPPAQPAALMRARTHASPARPPDFVIVTDEAAGRTIPNAFLDRVKEDFITK